MLKWEQGDPIDHERRIWKLLTFIGRYGKQPFSCLLPMTIPELVVVSECVAEILREEAKQGPLTEG